MSRIKSSRGGIDRRGGGRPRCRQSPSTTTRTTTTSFPFFGVVDRAERWRRVGEAAERREETKPWTERGQRPVARAGGRRRAEMRDGCGAQAEGKRRNGETERSNEGDRAERGGSRRRRRAMRVQYCTCEEKEERGEQVREGDR